jgi:hypothetical protein
MTDLTEEQARQMEAGEELNHICAEWLGLEPHTGVTMQVDGEHRAIWSDGDPWLDEHGTIIELAASTGEWPPVDGKPPAFSTDWSAAGTLLEVLRYRVSMEYSFILWNCNNTKVLASWGKGTPLPLAIARACAVLVARGVTREEVHR